MNISKAEQRTLHALARGGAVFVDKNEKGDVVAVNCATREGWTLADCTTEVFRKLRKRRFIASSSGGPYRLTLLGRRAVRSEPDNR
ncbi:MAG: YjhX family toxin [Parvularculaceae bacterium]|nr:YjhX family toxin [Parvularculaceae bacterium]